MTYIIRNITGDQMSNVNIHSVLKLAVSTGSIIILVVVLVLCVKFIKKKHNVKRVPQMEMADLNVVQEVPANTRGSAGLVLTAGN